MNAPHPSQGDYIRTKHGAETLAHADGVWHGFGKPLKPDSTIEEIEEAAGIGWEVELRPLYTKGPSGEDVEIANRKALVRATDGKCFDVTGKDWRPNQNRAALELTDIFVRAGKMAYVAAGAVRDGAHVFVQARAVQGFSLFNGRDDIEQIITFGNPHKHGCAVSVTGGSQRMWCANQAVLLTRAGKLAISARFNHTAVHQFNKEKALTLLSASNAAMEVFREQATALTKTKISRTGTSDYLRRVFKLQDLTVGTDDQISRSRKRNQNIIDKLIEAHHTQPGAKLGEGTLWQAFNTVTYATDHGVITSPAQRQSSALVGSGAVRKMEALREALALV
jgi:phage/plasmid-like protein (TIGR03299 family)